MTQIIVDATIASRLNNFCHPVELCDLSGRVLGHFVPLIDMTEWEPVTPDITEEELQRRKQNTGKTYTTAEVLAHLEKL